MSNDSYQNALASERDHVAYLYTKWESDCADVNRRLQGALGDSTATAGEERWQRQVLVDSLATKLDRLRAAENGLCFGRVDRADDQSAYIGRIGLLDKDPEQEPLLLDWRAPAARPFYTATAAQPDGLIRRRHFRARGRDLLDFHEDVFDLEAVDDTADANSALLAALNAPREPAMRDIVATIQTEQDDIIRMPDTGLLVIEGGPGTGKTAVALHRVAYLLYTHRERLSRSGVLLIGPHSGFLDYIGNVLPSLGETDVVFATTGDLMPGVQATAEDLPNVKRIKGNPAMIEVLTSAVTDRQQVPETPLRIELSDVAVAVDQPMAAKARDHARSTGLRHNAARDTFRTWLVEYLVERAVDEIGRDWLTAEDTYLRAEFAADVRAELTGNPQVGAVVDRLWPYLTPQRLLTELYTSRARIDAAAGALDADDRALLYREYGAAWTKSDVPLLDEAAELLGEHAFAAAEARREHDEQAEYARGVLQILDTDPEIDDESLRAVDIVDAEALAERHVARDHRTLAERAAADREWTYGHVVIDEAQELSAMDWRTVMRRCPSKSMTIVGDLAQRQSTAGARTWTDMVDAYAPGRWNYRRLTVNYRTPVEIMDVAVCALADDHPSAAPRSVRSTGVRPVVWPATRNDDLPRVVADVIRANLDTSGLIGVIAPEGLDLADQPATVLTPQDSKGLEFDIVVLVEPHSILTAAGQGAAGLYVALTRATQQLHIVHALPLPPALTDALGNAEWSPS